MARFFTALLVTLLLAGCSSGAIYHEVAEAMAFRPFHGIFQSERTENWYFDLNRPDPYKVSGLTVLGTSRYRLRSVGPATPNEVELEMVCQDSVVYRFQARHLSEDSIRVTFEADEPYDAMTLVRRQLEPEIMRMIAGRSDELTPCSRGR